MEAKIMAADRDDTEDQHRQKTNQQTNQHTTMNDNAHTDTIELKSEENRTHALLCAIVAEQSSRRKELERTGNERDKEYLAHLEDLEKEVADIYFHDRRVASPDVDVEADD